MHLRMLPILIKLPNKQNDFHNDPTEAIRAKKVRWGRRDKPESSHIL